MMKNPRGSAAVTALCGFPKLAESLGFESGEKLSCRVNTQMRCVQTKSFPVCGWRSQDRHPEHVPWDSLSDRSVASYSRGGSIVPSMVIDREDSLEIGSLDIATEWHSFLWVSHWGMRDLPTGSNGSRYGVRPNIWCGGIWAEVSSSGRKQTQRVFAQPELSMSSGWVRNFFRNELSR